MATSSTPEAARPVATISTSAPRRFRSLRLRVLAVAGATLLVTLSIAGLALAYIFENNIERTIEQDLDVEWNELAASFALDADGTPAVVRDLSDPRYRTPYGGAYWRIDENGVRVLQSRSLWDQTLTARDDVHFSPRGMAVEQRGPNDTTVYVTTRAVALQGASGLRHFDLAVAVDTHDMELLRASFASDVAQSLLVIGLLLFAGAVLQVSFGLAPLAALRRQMAEIHAGRAKRLAGAFPDEVAPLVDDLNALLKRQEDLVQRARSRAGDLAHGLKTPLTILQRLERRCREKGDIEAATTLREQIDAMRNHVERELSRARTHGAVAAGGTLTDVRSTVDRLIGLFIRMPRGDEIDWRNAVPDGLRLRMDPDDFGEVMGNLLDNARKAAASVVRISAEVADGRTRILVDDDGPGVTPGRFATLLQRGHSEDTTAEGTGLGLGIVVDVLGEYDAQLSMEANDFGGARAVFAIDGVDAVTH